MKWSPSGRLLEFFLMKLKKERNRLKLSMQQQCKLLKEKMSVQKMSVQNLKVDHKKCLIFRIRSEVNLV